MIAVIISDITNPFYFGIIRGAQAAAAEVGYTMLLADAQESDVLEREALDRALPTVEGIVLASSRMSDSAIHMTAKQKPMMVLNRAVADVPSLVTDNPGGVRRAVEHLAHLGHRSITYLAGPEASWADGVRWRSLVDAAKEHDIHTRRVGPNAPTVAGGEHAAATLTHRWSTAYLAYNDQVAIGFMRRLMATGRGPAGGQRRRLRQHLCRGPRHSPVDNGGGAAARPGDDRGAQSPGDHQRGDTTRRGTPGAARPPGGTRLDRSGSRASTRPALADPSLEPDRSNDG